MDLNRIPDDTIREEYTKRFSIPAGKRIGSCTKAADHIRSHLSSYRDREAFVAVYLNAQHQCLCTEVLFVGSLTSSAIYPRELVARVLKHSAAGIIVGHNHPSGTLQPSGSDRAITRKLVSAMQAIDVDFLDHLIVTTDAYLSFAEEHLL